jgi:hypothetical protein
MVQSEPWLTRDKVMIDVLKTIGIEKGKQGGFNPDAKTRAILDDAARKRVPGWRRSTRPRSRRPTSTAPAGQCRGRRR